MRAARLAPDPGSTPRLHLFDGLRGVLAVYVMLGHMAPMLPLTPTGRRIMTALFGHGLAAVDLFFALSGLVIVQSLARFEGRVGAFLIARARRLLPVYYVVLIAAMISLALPTPFAVMPWLHPGDAAHQIWAAGLPASLGAHLLAHLLLIQGALPLHTLNDVQFSLLGPAWSLSTEWQFYALIALLTLGLGAAQDRLIPLVWIFLGLAMLGRVYAVSAPADWQFHRAFLPNQAGYFALGIAAARFWRTARATPLFIITLIIAIMLAASHGTTAPMHAAKALPPLAWALMVWVQRQPEHRLTRPLVALLSHRTTQWLGAISYPLYVLNEPVGRMTARVIGVATHAHTLWFSLLWVPLSVGLSIGLAAVLHYQLERRWMRRGQTTLMVAPVR